MSKVFRDKGLNTCSICRYKSEYGSDKNYCDKYPNGKPEEVINKEAECSKYEEVRNWVELHKDEQMSSEIADWWCKYCKGCKYIDKTMGYDANCCEKYPNINEKPEDIKEHEAKCKFYEKG